MPAGAAEIEIEIVIARGSSDRGILHRGIGIIRLAVFVEQREGQLKAKIPKRGAALQQLGKLGDIRGKKQGLV